MAGSDLVTGTLDILILKALTWGPRHGYGVAEWIEQATASAFLVGEGTLYPALHRLEKQGLIEAEWGVSENNRRARFYKLTRAGRKQLCVEESQWEHLAAAVAKVLQAT